MAVDLYITLPEDFEERYNSYKEKLGVVAPEVRTKSLPPNQASTQVRDTFLYTKELTAELSVGKLGMYSDGTIRYKKTILNLRNQLKDLCRLFIRNPKRLVTIDDIRDNIIATDKRESTPNATIAKYVSELHTVLKKPYGKDVIFSQKEEGWHFDPDKK